MRWRAELHLRELGLADHLVRLARRRDVERHEVALAHQLGERGERPVVAHRKLRRDVEEDDAHAHRLGEHADLRADVAVADDAERLAADLVAVRRDLAPLPFVHFARPITELAREHDDLGDDELRDAARVRERRVEDRHAARVRRIEVDLVRADAEAADREKPPGVLAPEHLFRHVRLRADAEDVDAIELRDELLGLEGLLQELDLERLLLEEILRPRVDALEQEDLELVLRQRVTHRRPRSAAKRAEGSRGFGGGATIMVRWDLASILG